MSLKKIITVPDETLRKNSEPIEKVGDNEKKLIKDLFETMYHNNGIGLAAIQVGIPKRIIVLDVSQKDKKNSVEVESFELKESIDLVLKHPTVASKSFLITIGDRTVGGMTARDQFVGPWQVPTSNFSMSLRSFTDHSGEVVTIGEKPTIAINNPAASMRMAMAEALTNMVSVPILGMDQIQVSANWMAASGENIEDLALRYGVEALSNFAVEFSLQCLIASTAAKSSISVTV